MHLSWVSTDPFLAAQGSDLLYTLDVLLVPLGAESKVLYHHAHPVFLGRVNESEPAESIAMPCHSWKTKDSQMLYILMEYYYQPWISYEVSNTTHISSVPGVKRIAVKLEVVLRP